MTDDEIIEVVRAHKEGKQIQHRLNENTDGDPADRNWKDVEIGRFWPWNFANFVYRVKPEPGKPREWSIYYRNGRPEATEINVDRQPMNGTSVRVREVIE